MTWISINDDLPDYGKKVMVKSKNHERVGYLSNDYIYGRDYWCVFTSLILHRDVTHWRPLTDEEMKFSNTRRKPDETRT